MREGGNGANEARIKVNLMSGGRQQMATDVRKRANRGSRACATRLLWSAICASGVVIALALSAMPGVASAAECPNEEIRIQQGPDALALPECRAYEMVSPVGSAPSAQYNQRARASVNGERFAYFSWNPYPGQGGEGLYLLSTRGAAGWSTQSVTPPQSAVKESSLFSCKPSIYFDAEMTRGLLADGVRDGERVCEGDQPPLVEGEPRGIMNLFRRNSITGAYQLVDPVPVGGASPENAYPVGTTPEMEQIVFSERAPLTANAPAGGARDLYDWSEGKVSLVSVLPDGTPVEGELANAPNDGAHGSAPFTHSISATGNRLFFYVFEAGGEKGALYARLNPMAPQSALVPGSSKVNGEQCSEPAKACTVELDAAAPGAEGPSGKGVFLDASANGSRIFFADESRLTTDSKAGQYKPDVYEYDLETHQLTDITADPTEPADVYGYMGASAEGADIYLVAGSALTGADKEGRAPTTGKANLYVWHEGTMEFIAEVSEGTSVGEGTGWRDFGGKRFVAYERQVKTSVGVRPRARVSPNGRFMTFDSAKELTHHDNHPAEPGDCGAAEHCEEIFLYDSVEGKLACVSCAGPGVQPTGPATVQFPEGAYEGGGPMRLSRSLLDDGRVFFDTRTPLSPRAINGMQNVYEYKAGAQTLISSGTATGESEFLEASAGGNDVFFETDQSLVQADTDNADSVYDARVGGGLEPAPSEYGPSTCKSVEECKPPLGEPPVEAFPASGAFAGAGNIHVAAPRGKGGNGPRGRGKGKRRGRRARRLSRALKRCRHKPRRRRASCRRRARRRYGRRHVHRARGRRRRQTKHRHAKRAGRRHGGRRGGKR